jgi:hypothetical protein
MKLISRQEAVKFGKSRYYTGKECKNGHIDERYTLRGTCVTCCREAVRALRKKILTRRKDYENENGTSDTNGKKP